MIPLPSFKHTAKFALDRLGLSAVLCLDAGDLASYGGTAQQWNDVSGAGNHFNRGTTSGAEATDPTFNGVAGAKTAAEYFSTDGGDFFTPSGAPTFDDTWHRDGALFTLVAIFWCTSFATTGTLFGNSDSGTLQGLRFTRNNTSGSMLIVQQNGTVGQSFNSGRSAALNGWTFAAVSFNESAGAGGCNWQVNNATFALDATITSPSAGLPNNAPQLLGRGGTGVGQAPAAGDRLALFVASAAAWSPAQLAAFRNIMRTRFPGI